MQGLQGSRAREIRQALHAGVLEQGQKTSDEELEADLVGGGDVPGEEHGLEG